MNSKHIAKAVLSGWIASLVLSGIALAADPASAVAPEPTKDMRAQMATLHEQMAACLRSDKPFNDCRNEMMTGCKSMMGKNGCPMMGMGRRGAMMRGPRAPAPSP